MSERLVGQFTPIEKFAQFLVEKLELSKTIYTARLPNEIAKFTVDLSAARTDTKLSSRGGAREPSFDYDNKYPTWHYLKTLVKGTGLWTLKFVMPGKRTVSLSQDEVTRGDEIFLEFEELEFTNIAQDEVISPVLWIEKRYF